MDVKARKTTQSIINTGWTIGCMQMSAKWTSIHITSNNNDGQKHYQTLCCTQNVLHLFSVPHITVNSKATKLPTPVVTKRNSSKAIWRKQGADRKSWMCCPWQCMRWRRRCSHILSCLRLSLRLLPINKFLGKHEFHTNDTMNVVQNWLSCQPGEFSVMGIQTSTFLMSWNKETINVHTQGATMSWKGLKRLDKVVLYMHEPPTHKWKHVCYMLTHSHIMNKLIN